MLADKPNKKTFGIPSRLYMMAADDPYSDFDNWLKRKETKKIIENLISYKTSQFFKITANL